MPFSVFPIVLKARNGFNLQFVYAHTCAGPVRVGLGWHKLWSQGRILALPPLPVLLPTMGEEEGRRQKCRRSSIIPVEVPPLVLHLDLVLAMEEQLTGAGSICNMLKHALVEEWFKVGYLEAVVARAGAGGHTDGAG